MLDKAELGHLDLGLKSFRHVGKDVLFEALRVALVAEGRGHGSVLFVEVNFGLLKVRLFSKRAKLEVNLHRWRHPRTSLPARAC